MAPPDAGDDGRILDGFLLLASAGSASPDEVVSANLSSLEIVDLVDEDLSFFGHLDRLDVSDNRLASEHILRQIGNIPKLSTLSLACNSLAALVVPKGTLQHLHTLDLSFNSLQGEVLAQLSCLSNLVHLNLSSNCISLVPQEKEIVGLQSLEELQLDNNDLVQFVQWRALDALPRLKKLSLASNRIKRLMDDLPEFEYGDDMFYFRSLEDLDLASNEIASLQLLPVLRQFRKLRKLQLSENPCMADAAAGKGEEVAHFPGIGIFAEHRKQWYLSGNGCFQSRQAQEPRVKLDRRTLKRVASAPVLKRTAAPRALSSPLPPPPPASAPTARPAADDGDEANCFLTSLGAPPPAAAASSAAAAALSPEALVMDDGLSEAELDGLLRQRRLAIDEKFREEVEDPPSFMRRAPWRTLKRSSTYEKGSLLNFIPEEEPAVRAGASGSTASHRSEAREARRSASAAVLPGVPLGGSDEAAAVDSHWALALAAGDGASGGAGAGAATGGGSAALSRPGGGKPELVREAELDAAEQQAGAASPPAAPAGRGGGLVLPAIQPGPRQQAAAVAGVREAMRALRAAALADGPTAAAY